MNQRCAAGRVWWLFRRAAAALAALGGIAVALTISNPGPADASAAPPPGCASAATPRLPATPDHPITLAHYYIWFTANSWSRAKIDYPAIGRYSSDQVSVMRKQVAQAMQAGIDGFIVSWKDTPALDARLAALVTVANEAHFKLAITYEGQDFNRDPLPAERVASDLQAFAHQYATNPAFDIYGKPLVVVSGTWNYNLPDLQHITAPVRDKLLVLASAKNVTDYQRVADYVDGDLYYWSSVNPQSTPGYAAKLVSMGAAVHDSCGIWIAPAAPGFDARLVGGKTVVPRRSGETLREEWATALASVPDAIGVISWNEFSENTYIEPSRNYGSTALHVLSLLTGSPTPFAEEFDSSEPSGGRSIWWSIGTFGAALAGLAGVGMLGRARARRQRGSENRQSPTQPPEANHGTSHPQRMVGQHSGRPTGRS